MSDDPGTFQNNTSTRTNALPYFKKKNYAKNFYVYRSAEIKKHVANQQDGVYHLIALNSSNAPDISPFSGENFSQNLVDLYPQTDRDNPNSDPTQREVLRHQILLVKFSLMILRTLLQKRIWLDLQLIQRLV